MEIDCVGGTDEQTWTRTGCDWGPADRGSGLLRCTDGIWSLSYFETGGPCAFETIDTEMTNTDGCPEGNYSGGTGHTARVTCIPECPTDCSGCTATWTLVISGFTGSCAYQNGSFDTALYLGNCSWMFDDYMTIMSCGSGFWTIFLPEGGQTITIGTGSCPPASGGGSVASSAPACSGQTFSWTLTSA